MKTEFMGTDRIVLTENNRKKLPHEVHLRGGGEQTTLAAFLNKGEAWTFAHTVADRMKVEVMHA